MLNAQAWLDKEYPKNGICRNKKNSWGEDNKNFGKKREEIKRLDITYQGLEGDLKLEGFTCLESFNDTCDNKLIKLDISSAKKLKSVFRGSQESKNELVELVVGNLPDLEVLFCKGNELTNLDLEGCPNLKILDCSKNKLTNLRISNCSQLKELNCQSNRLTDFDELSILQKLQLENLDISFNRFFGNLTDLSHLINLRKLSISSNSFVGSLEALKNMNELTILNIDSTNIDRGLEYLPESLLRISCSSTSEFIRQMMRDNPDCW